jgi:23S rRNA (uridine2552-2'-O)-methyltransferase
MTIKDRDRLDDPWARKARKEGYPARSVYKLEEMDLKRRLFRKGMRVLDLGASPGSWSLYALKRVSPGGKVLAVDLNPPAGGLRRPGLEFRREDVLTLDPAELMSEGPFGALISDLAPPTTGRRDADAERSLTLARAALRLATDLLSPNGVFVAKVFDGADSGLFFQNELRPLFTRAVRMRPKAVRKGSVESYVIGLGLTARPRKTDAPGTRDALAGPDVPADTADPAGPADTADKGSQGA